METQGNESVGTESTESTGTAETTLQTTDGSTVTETEVQQPVEPASFKDKITQKAQSKTEAAKKETAKAAAPETPAYTPNLKFKVLDKEHEFEDWAKGLVKDAEMEKKIREIHEKAYGLDSVKNDRHSLKTQLGEVNNKLQTYESRIQDLYNAKNGKDYDTFFEAWQIPKEDVIRYALDVIKREQDPAEMAAWENNRRATFQQQQYEQQQQQLTQSQRDFAVQKRGYELDMELSKPDISSIAQAYDTGTGRPGSFREYVIQVGAAAFATDGKDLPPGQVIQSAIGHLRAVNPTFGVSQPNGQQTSKVVAPQDKPVIPNIKGTGSSPVRPRVKSIADIKKRAQELDAQMA